jgi:enhancing lycopene biosynthesis protein 2
MASLRNFRAAVVLSGCGVYDGSEITEAVSMLISLSKNGAQY